MLNKFLGSLLYVVGIVLILSTLANLTKIIANFVVIFHPNSAAFARGQALGYIFGALLFIVLIYFCFKFGNKLFKKS